MFLKSFYGLICCNRHSTTPLIQYIFYFYKVKSLTFYLIFNLKNPADTLLLSCFILYFIIYIFILLYVGYLYYAMLYAIQTGGS